VWEIESWRCTAVKEEKSLPPILSMVIYPELWRGVEIMSLEPPGDLRTGMVYDRLDLNGVTRFAAYEPRAVCCDAHAEDVALDPTT
jgi:hypothetical protein